MKIIKNYWPYGAAFFLLITFTRLIDFNGLYGQDSYEYLRYARCLVSFIKTGANPGDYFWPLLYPITGALLSFAFSLPLALQLISIFSLVLSAVYLEKIIVFLYNVQRNIVRYYVLLFLLLSPYLLRGALVIMSDGLSVFCITAAWYYFLMYRKSPGSKQFLAFVFFSAVAVATRYATFILLVIPSIYVLWIFLKNFKWLSLIMGTGIMIVLFTPHFIIRSHAPLGFIHHEWLESWSPANFFRTRFDTLDGKASYTFYNLFYVFFNIVHPAFCFAGLLFVALWLFRVRTNIRTHTSWLFILSVILYALFLAGIPYQNMRFLLLSFPLVLVVLFEGYGVAVNYIDDKKTLKYVAAIGVVVIQAGLFYKVFIPFYSDNRVEKQIAQQMLKYADSKLYTFSIDGALKAYGYRGDIINMWSVRLDTLKGSTGTVLILFNEKQFSEQWKNKNPMINWEYLNKQYVLTEIQVLPDGWGLYKIEGRN